MRLEASYNHGPDKWEIRDMDAIPPRMLAEISTEREARLFTAAPELLDAAKYALGMFRAEMEMEGPGAPLPHQKFALNTPISILEEVIAKAEGK